MRPTLFHLGSVPIRSFGVMVLIGFVLALWYAMSQARQLQQGDRGTEGQGEVPNARTPEGLNAITPDHVFDMSLGALFVAIIGARLLYILLDPWEFRSHPLDMLRIWEGGISVHGAIISGALYLWWFCRRHKLPFLQFGDIAAPAFALGYAVGRVGCFLNGCCYGAACDLPWAVRFLKDEKIGMWTPPSHPTQLYATAMNLAVFGILHLWSRRAHPRGAILLGLFGFYCVYRFIDEQFRKGATADIFAFGLTHAQAFSLVALPVILFLLVRVYRAPRPQSQSVAPVEPEATPEPIESAP